jgi:hypothetical protein
MTGAWERHALGMRNMEGNAPIPLAAYIYLTNMLIKGMNPSILPPISFFPEQTWSSMPTLTMFACTLIHCAFKLSHQRDIKKEASTMSTFSCVLQSSESCHLTSIGIL